MTDIHRVPFHALAGIIPALSRLAGSEGLKGSPTFRVIPMTAGAPLDAEGPEVLTFESFDDFLKHISREHAAEKSDGVDTQKGPAAEAAPKEAPKPASDGAEGQKEAPKESLTRSLCEVVLGSIKAETFTLPDGSEVKTFPVCGASSKDIALKMESGGKERAVTAEWRVALPNGQGRDQKATILIGRNTVRKAVVENGLLHLYLQSVEPTVVNIPVS